MLRSILRSSERRQLQEVNAVFSSQTASLYFLTLQQTAVTDRASSDPSGEHLTPPI